MKLKRNDEIVVIRGKDKGKKGKIEKVMSRENKVLIPGLNIYKRHVKGQGGQKGGIYEIPRPYSFAKISLICPKCKKVTRVGFRIMKDEKVRICRKCKKEIDTK